MRQAVKADFGGRPDDEIHLRDAFYLLVRNRLLIVVAVALGVSAAALYNNRVPSVFQATSSIRVFESRTNPQTLEVLRSLSTGAGIETEMEVLRSRTLSEAVVDSLGLRLRVVRPEGVSRSALIDSVVVESWAPPGRYELLRSADAVGASPDSEVPGVGFRVLPRASDFETLVLEVVDFEEAVEELKRHLIVDRPNRDAGIVSVRFQSPDSQLVHAVPNALVSLFMQRRLAARRFEATSTARFLEVQIDTVSRHLDDADRSLTAFREDERVVSIETEARTQVAQLARLQAERNILDTERSALQRLMSDIEEAPAATDPTQRSPYTRLISFPPLYRNQVTSELIRGLNEADARRSRLLERRTLRDPDVMNITGYIRGLESQLRGIVTTYLLGLTNQVLAYDETLARFEQELERIPEKEVELARLQRSSDVLGDLLTVLQQRLYESRILEAAEDAGVDIVDPAIEPREPQRPVPPLNLALGLTLGAMLGVLVAFAREFLDSSVHTRRDLRESTGGLPVLGVIPPLGLVGGTRGSAPTGQPLAPEARLVTRRDSRSPASEAYRTLGTNLTFADPDRPLESLVFTSPLPHDGKSTTAANLAVTLAQQGRRVLLVDADLRRGVLEAMFGVAREPGLTDVLVGHAEIDVAIREIELGESGRLYLLPSGPLPPNPAEVLGSARMRELLGVFESRFDIVILDSPPLTVVTDAAVIGMSADGVVLVARASATSRGALAYAVEQLRHVRAHVLGSVLTDVDSRKDSRYRTGDGSYGPPVFVAARG